MTSPFPAHSLRLPCPAFNYYTLACPRRICTTPRPGAAVHRTTEYIAQYYLCPRCTSQPVRTSVPRSTSTSTYTSTSTSPRYISLPPSLPGWWFLTLTIPPRCCPPTPPPSSPRVCVCLVSRHHFPLHFHFLALTHSFSLLSCVSFVFLSQSGPFAAVRNASERSPLPAPLPSLVTPGTAH